MQCGLVERKGVDQSNDFTSGACADFQRAAQQVVDGQRYSDVAALVEQARTGFEKAGEPIAESYLYGWGDPLRPTSAAERSEFWVSAFEYARTEGNPGMLRIDEICGRQNLVASTEMAGPPDTLRVEASPVPTSRETAVTSSTTPETTTTMSSVETTTTMSSVTLVDGTTGSGTLDDPFDNYGDGLTFDTFQAEFSVRYYPAGRNEQGAAAQVCLVIGYQAADGVAGVEATDLIGRIRLVDSAGNPLEVADESARWPDDMLASLDGADRIVWGYIVRRALCYPANNLPVDTNLLARVDDIHARPWFHPGYAMPTAPELSADNESCDVYEYDDQLPISMCANGTSVQLVQDALGVEADGYFGPGTRDALEAFQSSASIAATGEIDAETWRALGIAANTPYPDLNGDGVVDASEFPGN